MNRYVHVRIVGYELSNAPGDTLNFAEMEWPALVGFGYLYGWRPNSIQNTEVMYSLSEETLEHNWFRSLSDYVTHGSIIMQAEEVNRFTDALEKALTDVEEQNLPSFQLVERFSGNTIEIPQYVYERFGDNQKQRLADFIEFCRRGKSNILIERKAEYFDLGPIGSEMYYYRS